MNFKDKVRMYAENVEFTSPTGGGQNVQVEVEGEVMGLGDFKSKRASLYSAIEAAVKKAGIKWEQLCGKDGTIDVTRTADGTFAITPDGGKTIKVKV